MMELIVWHVIYLVQSHMVVLDQMCLLNKVLDHEERLMREKDVHFSTTLEIVLAHRITVQ